MAGTKLASNVGFVSKMLKASAESETKEQKLAKVFGQIEMFKNLTDKERKQIEKEMVSETFEGGSVIFREGEEGDSFSVISEGRCAVLIKGKRVHMLTAGSYFGERALLTNELRAATIQAVGYVQLFTLNKIAFESILGPKILQGDMSWEKAQEEKITENSKQNVAKNSQAGLNLFDCNSIFKMIDMFNVLSVKERKILARKMVEETYEGGAVVVKQGDKGSKFYIVTEGSCDVFIDGNRIQRLATGSFFGENALLDGDRKRAATVQASATGARLLSLSKESLDEVLSGVKGPGCVPDGIEDFLRRYYQDLQMRRDTMFERRKAKRTLDLAACTFQPNVKPKNQADDFFCNISKSFDAVYRPPLQKLDDNALLALFSPSIDAQRQSSEDSNDGGGLRVASSPQLQPQSQPQPQTQPQPQPQQKTHPTRSQPNLQTSFVAKMSSQASSGKADRKRSGSVQRGPFTPRGDRHSPSVDNGSMKGLAVPSQLVSDRRDQIQTPTRSKSEERQVHAAPIGPITSEVQPSPPPKTPRLRDQAKTPRSSAGTPDLAAEHPKTPRADPMSPKKSQAAECPKTVRSSSIASKSLRSTSSSHPPSTSEKHLPPYLRSRSQIACLNNAVQVRINTLRNASEKAS